jgi:hypothetical protein
MGRTVSRTRSLAIAGVENYSEFEVQSDPSIETLRSGRFRKEKLSVFGAAPKDFIRVYEHGSTNRANPSRWPAYIAKVGHKWYPNESITEHFLTRLGQGLGLRIADSRLMWVRGQLRFLSRFFLRRQQSLVHGAEIFSRHVGDEEFVREVEENNASRDIFTFQVVEQAVAESFPEQAEDIIRDFTRLLGFDALIGNNDRHYYNWGVITDVTGSITPRFSPIFDTARALFWNTPESGLLEAEERKQVGQFITNYVVKCTPKTGWDGRRKINHFDLIGAICQERPALGPILQELGGFDIVQTAETLMDGEFCNLFSERRRNFVVSCLEKRLQEYRKCVF